MGIRFYCPQGHKLNVKSFLAGKVGVCPHCDARVQIPFTSTRPSSKALDQGGENQETALPLASPLEDVDQVLPVAEAIDAGKPAAPVEKQSVEDALLPMPQTALPGNAAAKMPPAANGDPLSESPEAQWYVCPETGGQNYGPADATVMRQWIDEGRVLANHLVWREGWGQWQRAGVCFPHLDHQSEQG